MWSRGDELWATPMVPQRSVHPACATPSAHGSSYRPILLSSSFFSCLESPFPSRRFFSTGEKSGEIAISRLRRMCFLITFRWIGLHFFHFKEQRVCSILYFIFSNNGRISNGDSHPPLDDTYFDLKISIL